MAENALLYAIRNLRKQRQREQGYRLLIRNLEIAYGARIALTGPSGCGKSTALDILGLSLRPDSADAYLFQPKNSPSPTNIMDLWLEKRQDSLAGLRLHNMGYVLQSGELLPFLSTGENMTLTARLGGMPSDQAEDAARGLAETLGIGHLWKAMPSTLSVGERQRAAICRALAPHPQIILADEPTAALDPFHADKVMAAFLSALEKFGSTLVLVTHNAQWAREGGLVEVPFIMREDESGVTAILDYKSGGGR